MPHIARRLQHVLRGWIEGHLEVMPITSMTLSDGHGPGERASTRRSARLGSRLLTAQRRQPNEQSAAVDAAPPPRDQQARGSVWLRRTVQQPGHARSVSDVNASTVLRRP